MTSQRLVIVVTLSILAAIILLAVTCFVFREDLLRATLRSAISSFYTTIVADTSLHVDSTAAGTILHTFGDRIDTMKLDSPEMIGFMHTMQDVYSDRKIDRTDLDSAMAKIFAIYPDLNQAWSTDPVGLDSSGIATDSIPSTADSATVDTTAP